MSITFLVLSYNQEAFVADAIRSVLAQQGQPIDILISDDASTDTTFQIIQSVTACYFGPHNVSVRRNTRNLGLANHINHCMRLVKTEYVVASAADDISDPRRAQIVRDAFRRSNALLLYSRFNLIDSAGKEISGHKRDLDETLLKSHSALQIATSMSLYVGATGAWSSSLFQKYGDIAVDCYEDLILGFRAALERRIHHIDEPLVMYRQDSGMTKRSFDIWSPSAWRRDRKRFLTLSAAVLSQRLRDVKVSSHSERSAIIFKIEREISKVSTRLQVLEFGFVRSVVRNPGSMLKILALSMSELNRMRIAKRSSAAR